MTDMPKTGFLCAGKNPLELSVSVHCAHKLMEALKSAGFTTGSCYTEICANPTPEKIRHAAKTLSHLCLANDLVLTVGCEGFASGDIIPDVTDAVCPRKAVYFSNVLCGSLKITQLPDENNYYSSDMPLRMYPDEAASISSQHCTEDSRHTLSSKLDIALQKLSDRLSEKSGHPEEQYHGKSITYGSAANILNKSQKRAPYGNSFPSLKSTHEKCTFPHQNMNFPSGSADESSAPLSFEHFCDSGSAILEIPPSRSTSGICENALILNLSNDVYTTVKLIKALIPAIGFTVYNLSGKSAASAIQFEKSLKSSPECKDFFKKCSAIND